MFPQAEFEAFATQAPQPAPDRPPDPGLPRMFVAGASSETADSQGRVVIRKALRGRGLSKDVVLLGPDPPGRDLGQGGVGHRAVAEAAYADETNAAHLAELGIWWPTAARHQPVMVDQVTVACSTSAAPPRRDRCRRHPWPRRPQRTPAGGQRPRRPRHRPRPRPGGPGAGRRRLAWAGDRLVAVAASFEDLGEVAARLGVDAVDEVLYDLGVSSLQLDEGDRGFSYRADAPLDMRMDPTTGISAAEVVATYPRPELARILREYGEERFAGRIARVLDGLHAAAAPSPPPASWPRLVKAAVPAAAGGPVPTRPRRAFQALRIEVNRELDALRASTAAGHRPARPRRGLVVLAYHSLEDYIVKQAWPPRPAGRSTRRRTASPSTRRPPRPPPWRC